MTSQKRPDPNARHAPFQGRGEALYGGVSIWSRALPEILSSEKIVPTAIGPQSAV